MIRNSRGVSDDMAHQLYTYQQLTLNFLQHRMNMVMREDDQVRGHHECVPDPCMTQNFPDGVIAFLCSTILSE